MALSDRALLAEISRDRAVASRVLFAHRHPQESPAFHVEIVDLWRCAEPFVLIEGFRECAKSTLAEEFLLTEAAFGNFRYCLIIGETYTKACQRLEAVKHEAVKNAKLAQLFGRLKGDIWNENTALFANGVYVEALGWEQEFRSFKFHDARPDRAFLDDIENRSMVRDSASVDRTMKKLYMELLPAMDKDRGKIRVVGTPLAKDCMVNRLRESPEWVSRRFPIADRDIDDPAARPSWPERYPIEWVRKRKAMYERDGMLREFLQEYMLIGSGEAGSTFEETQIVAMDVAPASWMPKILIMDPARTTAPGASCPTGRVVVSRLGTKVYVHESGNEYLKPDEIIRRCFDDHRRLGLSAVAIEKNSLDEWLLQPMRAEMMRRGMAIDLKALNAPQDRDKLNFIMGLQPFFRAGDIVLVGGKSAHPSLWAAIVNFPKGRIDVLNALAYVLRVYAGTPVYEEFGEWNLMSGYEPHAATPLALALNASSSECTAVLLNVMGERMNVLQDWVSSIPAQEFLTDILALVKAAYPNHRLATWVPADQLDQAERMPLVHAMRKLKLTPQRGAYVAAARGSLSPTIRTESRRSRLFRVDASARSTANALAGGYCYPSHHDARNRSSEPERGPYRTLIEGLESCVAALFATEQLAPGEFPAGANTAVSPGGTTFITARPSPRRAIP